MVGISHVALLVHALRGKNKEAIQDALNELTPEVYQTVTGQAQCIWMTKTLWLQPAKAGGDLEPGQKPLDHPDPPQDYQYSGGQGANGNVG